MYVTKRLSTLRKSPELLSRLEEGPNSGQLVLFDEESETRTCFGLCKDTTIRALPFPQNKNLSVLYTVGQSTFVDYVVFLPVLDQPLSSNRYYVIRRKGKHAGEVNANSKKDDIKTCCWWCTYIKDVKPGPIDLSDEYQQIEIINKKHGRFTAVSVAEDGNPPEFLRRKYWYLTMNKPRNYQLGEALGVDSLLRARFPEFDFSLESKVVVVGKWYCPFLFVKDGGIANLESQIKLSTFYEVTLEQRWEKIFGLENDRGDVRKSPVKFDVLVEKEMIFVGGRKVVSEERISEDGVVWFKSCDGEEVRVGLNTKVLERMKWEQERVGWVDGKETQVRVERREEFEGSSSSVGWTKFGCFVLVERFVSKRVDKSIVLEYDFKHTHQIRCKWE